MIQHKTTHLVSVKVRRITAHAAASALVLMVLMFRPAAMGARPIAAAQERNRAAAEQAIARAKELRTQGTVEARKGAIAKLEQALSLLQPDSDHRAKANILIDIGWIYDELGERLSALDSFTRALAVNRVANDAQSESDALRGIGHVHFTFGDTTEALDYYRRAMTLMRTAGDRGRQVWLLNDLGLLYYTLGDNEKALSTFEEGLVLARQVHYEVAEANLLTHIGNIHSVLGDKQKALNALNEALQLWRAMAHREGETGALQTIGRVYYSMGDYRKSLELLKQSLPLSEGTGMRSVEARAYHNIGRAYSALGEYEQALDYLRKALALWKMTGDPVSEASTVLAIARLERDRGNLSAALIEIDKALNTVESVRSRARSMELRETYLASVRNYYELKIDVLTRLDKTDPSKNYAAVALQVSEMSRARTLLESLNEAGADIREGVSQELLERERALGRQLGAKAAEQLHLLNNQPAGQQLAVMEKEITDLTTRYREVQAEIRSTSPRYAALTQPQPLSLADIQQQVLDPQTILLEYYLGDERSYLWVVAPDSIGSYELPKREEIEKAARRVYELLTARNLRVRFETVDERRGRIEKADAEYAQAAAVLSRIVLGPVSLKLADKRLLVVSDGALQYIPFGALPLPSTAPEQKDSTPVPLALRHEIVALPSAATLGALRHEISGRKPAAMTIAAIADPVFGRDDERIKGTSAPRKIDEPRLSDSEREMERSAAESGWGEEWHVSRVPFTRFEATAIAELVPERERKEALDFAANRATATSSGLSEYRIVHFATHGFLNSLHPELSGIVLSLVDEQGRDQDGFLRAQEIYNLKLPAELVVLSGCRTGLGKEIRGEGLVGLTRAFMYAGAARVMVSLWDINDKATAEFMTRFYRAMLGKEQMRPAAALRAAQLSMWKEKRWPSPYYWAAFELQGESR